MNNRILKVLERVSKLNDIFEWEVKDNTIFVYFKTPNNINSTRDSYIFNEEYGSELLQLERDVAKIEYDNGSQRVKDKKILNSFVQQYHELRAKFPDVKVYGLESACGARVVAEIDHGNGCRVMSKIED
jgi:hypothetical protein